MSSERIEELERQIADLERQWPAHSVSPTMLQQLDDLEEELEKERRKDTRTMEGILPTEASEEENNAKANGRVGL